jgi:hypothetical protein
MVKEETCDMGRTGMRTVNGRHSTLTVRRALALIVVLLWGATVHANEPVFNAYGGAPVEDLEGERAPFVVDKEQARQQATAWARANGLGGVVVGDPCLIRFTVVDTVADPEGRSLVTTPRHIYAWDAPLYDEGQRVVSLVRMDPYTGAVEELRISETPLSADTAGEWAGQYLSQTAFGRTHPDATLVRAWSAIGQDLFGADFRSDVAPWSLSGGDLPDSVIGVRYVQWFGSFGEPLGYKIEPLTPNTDTALGVSVPAAASPAIAAPTASRAHLLVAWGTPAVGAGVLAGILVFAGVIVAMRRKRRMAS